MHRIWPPVTGAELLARGTRELVAHSVPDPGRDARALLAHVLRVPSGRLTLFLPETVDPDLTVIFLAMIERRAGRVPVSHLTGRRFFYGRNFLVTPKVLDPRPETETLIEAALSEPFSSLLDLGTGSGCIALSLLAETKGTQGVATDISSDALGVAYWNRNSLSLDDRLTLLEGCWFEPLPDGARYDLIVSNPPYIAAWEMEGLSPDVRDYEPWEALTDQSDGLSAYRAIARDLLTYLEPAGRVLLEIGPTQAQAVTQLLQDAGLTQVHVIRDLDDRDRVIAGRAPGPATR